MDRRPKGAAMALAVGVFALSACAGSQDGAFQDRERLPSCGDHRLGPEQPPPADALTCLLEAGRQRRGAELAITRSTVEGDPLVTYYRSRPGKPGFEVLNDTTKDRYGSGGWARRICDNLKLERSELVCLEPR